MCFGQHLSHVCWRVARILRNETHSSSWYHHIQELFYAYSPICFYFVEFGWIRSATNHEICVLKDKWFKCASVSAFSMFFEDMLVFCELEPIVTLGITTFGTFCADSLIRYRFVAFGWIYSAINYEINWLILRSETKRNQARYNITKGMMQMYF